MAFPGAKCNVDASVIHFKAAWLSFRMSNYRPPVRQNCDIWISYRAILVTANVAILEGLLLLHKMTASLIPSVCRIKATLSGDASRQPLKGLNTKQTQFNYGESCFGERYAVGPRWINNP